MEAIGKVRFLKVKLVDPLIASISTFKGTKSRKDTFEGMDLIHNLPLSIDPMRANRNVVNFNTATSIWITWK